jgi:hypothetical protein
MSTSDVPPDEMGKDPNAADDALERMLSGEVPAADEWRDLDGFVQDLREAVPARPLASEDLHVAAMVRASHLIADKGDPVERPVSNADAPAPQVSRLPKLRRKQMKRSTRTLVRVFAPLAAVLIVMGSMAVAGALPHTVQKAVSHAAGTVGLNLPGDDEAQGDNNDDQGDNNNQGEDTQGDTQTGDQTGGTSGDQTGDQGDNSQGDNNNQGEDTQGDTQTGGTSGDETADQGDNSQGDNNNQGEDTQSGGSSGGDTQSGDSQGDSSSSGDSQGDGSSSGDSQGAGSSSGDSQGGNSQD